MHHLNPEQPTLTHHPLTKRVCHPTAGAVPARGAVCGGVVGGARRPAGQQRGSAHPSARTGGKDGLAAGLHQSAHFLSAA